MIFFDNGLVNFDKSEEDPIHEYSGSDRKEPRLVDGMNICHFVDRGLLRSKARQAHPNLLILSAVCIPECVLMPSVIQDSGQIDDS